MFNPLPDEGSSLGIVYIFFDGRAAIREILRYGWNSRQPR